MSVEIGTIVVGYLSTAEGAAAFEHAKQWALATEASLVVMNTGRNGDYVHPNFATAQDVDAIAAELAEAGVAHEVPAQALPA